MFNVQIFQVSLAGYLEGPVFGYLCGSCEQYFSFSVNSLLLNIGLKIEIDRTPTHPPSKVCEIILLHFSLFHDIWGNFFFVGANQIFYC